ncbi:MAG: VWA domain-containing protein, partial [Rikenellaceae bacterium]
CVLFSDKVEKYIQPKKGRGHVMMIIRELVGFKPESRGTDLAKAVSFFTNVNKKKCTCFMLSDFLSPNANDEDLNHALKIARSRHDMVAIRVEDPREAEMPDVGLVEFDDAETGERLLIDTSSRAVRDHYVAEWQSRVESIERVLNQNRVDSARVTTDADYVVELIKLFKQR